MESRVELFARIRRDARVEGLSVRALATRHKVHRRTVRQALESDAPPERKPRRGVAWRLEPFKPAIDEMLIDDTTAPRKQRHTARRVLARLIEEHDAQELSYSTVRDYVRVRRAQIDVEAGRRVEVLLAECDDRDRRSSIRRVKAANFPRNKWLGDFDFDANPNINPATIHTLATGDWIRKGAPLCLIGDSGTGKSHLLIGLGTAAAEQGYRVKYTLATRLVNELVEAADEKILAKTIARYGRVDLLCIDELGYMELDRRGAELLFQVLTEREEKNSMAIASNESFSGRTKTFTDPRLCAAIVDRLTFNGTIIETGTDSYRLAHTMAQQTPN